MHTARNKVLAKPSESKLREELSDVPLSDLLALRDRVGSKTFSKVYHNQDKVQIPIVPHKEKDRPPEFSSKKRPRPFFKKQTNERQRDPRFDQRTGAFSEDSFGRAYAFLDEVRQSERAEIEREMKTTDKEEDTKKLRTLLDRMKSQERARKERASDREVEKTWMKEERDKVGKGKKRYHLKKSVLRNLQLENRFQSSSGRRKIDKRRKRLEKKSRKNIPLRRE